MCWREGERGRGAGEHDGRGVLRRLRAATHRTVLRGVRPRLRGDGRGAGDEDMQEPEDDDDDIEEDDIEEGVEEEGLPSSSDDDENPIVELLVSGKRTRTPNTRFFNDNFA